MEGSASIGATQSAVMRSSRFRSSRATLLRTLGDKVPHSCNDTVRSGRAVAVSLLWRRSLESRALPAHHELHTNFTHVMRPPHRSAPAAPTSHAATSNSCRMTQMRPQC